MADVISAVNYIIKIYGYELSITPLKLQKLLYYSQAYHLVLLEAKKLFDNVIQAWDYGPVVPEIYHKYSSQPTTVLTLDASVDIDLKQESIEIVDEVINAYGQFSATRLIELTHREAPWKEAYARGRNSEIDTNRMQEFYTPYAKKEKI
jgi:uncharacterized phage-associated protein